MVNVIYYLLLIFFLSSCAIFNCIKGSGNIISEFRDIKNFKKITLKTSATLHLQQDGKYDIRIEAEDNIIPHIKTNLRKDELIISSTVCFLKHEPIRIYITSPDFTRINLAGSGKILGENILNVSNLEIELSGSGKIDLELNVQKLKSLLFGSGKITLSGNASNHQIVLTGSGIINSDELETENTTVNLSGSGNCRVNVKENLKINISGSGIVEYSGSPEIESNVSGTGKIKRIK